MVTCDDLKLGGTLSAAGLTGATSINSTALGVADWSTLFGTVGQSGTLVGVYGRPGVIVAGDRLPRERLLTLSVNVHSRVVAGEDCTPSEQALLDNTDTFLELASRRDGVYLEVTLPDGTTRFTQVENLDPGPMVQPSFFRRFNIPFVARWGMWWSGGQESSQVVSGGTVVAVGGTQIVYDAVLTFSAATTFLHLGLGWGIEALAGTFPLTVDLGKRLVYTGSNPDNHATNRIRRTVVPGDGRLWGWFEPGNNNTTAGANVTVTWRNQWL